MQRTFIDGNQKIHYKRTEGYKLEQEKVLYDMSGKANYSQSMHFLVTGQSGIDYMRILESL